VLQRVLDGHRPAGAEFEACRAVVRSEPCSDAGFQALCMLLEGALADPRLAIEDAQVVVPLLKALARGDVSPDQLT
jgi:hypothetical protein